MMHIVIYRLCVEKRKQDVMEIKVEAREKKKEAQNKPGVKSYQFLLMMP